MDGCLVPTLPGTATYLYISFALSLHIQSKLFITSLVITEYSISDIKLLGTH